MTVAPAERDAREVVADVGEERTDIIANAVADPGFSVTGSGCIEAVRITAIAADGSESG